MSGTRTTIIAGGNGQQEQAATDQRAGDRPSRINVGKVERWASLLGGGALAALGLGRRSRGGWALALAGGGLLLRGATGYCALYGALGLNRANGSLGRSPVASVPHGQGSRVERVVTINKAPEELYRFWRNFENLPRFMKHLQSVRTLDDQRSHWVANAPAGLNVEWDAELINDVEDELIAWRSLPGAGIGNAGSVRFRPAPGGRGTEVRVNLEYDPPAGALGVTVAKLFGEEPDRQVGDDLRRFKQLQETGEIPTTEGQPAGR